MPTVFLSSVFRELRIHRESVIHEVRRAGYNCVGLEEYPAMASSAEALCRDEVKKSDVVVLFVGQFYGSCPEGLDCSYTELEFRASLEPPGKPVLLFVCDPAYTVTAAIMDEYAMLPGGLDDQRKRKAQFLARVIRNANRDLFTTPDQLAGKVVSALSRHFSSGQVPLPPSLSAPDLPGDPVGRMLPYLCDRTPQKNDFAIHFDAAFQSRPHNPLLYVLYGAGEQRHESCVKRLVWEYIEQRRMNSAVRPFVPPADRFVELPSGNDAKIMYHRLLRNLFESVDPYQLYPRLDEESFCALASKVESPFLVLRHLVPRWDKACESLFQDRYLRFWDRVAAIWRRRQPAVRILLFFEIVYELQVPPGGQFEEITKVFRSRHRDLESKLSENRCVTFVLPDLQNVEQSEFQRWQERYRHLLSPELRDANFSELFGGSSAPMKLIEGHLKQRLGFN